MYDSFSGEQAARVTALQLVHDRKHSTVDDLVADAKKLADFILGEPRQTWEQQKAAEAHAALGAILERVDKDVPSDGKAYVEVGLARNAYYALAHFVEEPPF